MVTLEPRQLVVRPGQSIQLQDINWSEFEAILEELGDKRASRIAYSNGVLEIRMPLGRSQTLKAFRRWVRERVV